MIPFYKKTTIKISTPLTSYIYNSLNGFHFVQYLPSRLCTRVPVILFPFAVLVRVNHRIRTFNIELFNLDGTELFMYYMFIFWDLLILIHPFKNCTIPFVE